MRPPADLVGTGSVLGSLNDIVQAGIDQIIDAAGAHMELAPSNTGVADSVGTRFAIPGMPFNPGNALLHTPVAHRLLDAHQVAALHVEVAPDSAGGGPVTRRFRPVKQASGTAVHSCRHSQMQRRPTSSPCP